MRLVYRPETDSLYIELSPKPGVDASEIGDGVIVDVDAEGNPIGIDIERASQRIDLSTSGGGRPTATTVR